MKLLVIWGLPEAKTSCLEGCRLEAIAPSAGKSFSKFAADAFFFSFEGCSTCSMDDSRGRRAKPVNKAKSALAELAELRRTGQKRIATYEFEEEADVYDNMDDDEYSKFTAKRRDEAGKL